MATNDNAFPHLTFQVAHAGRARLPRGGETGALSFEAVNEDLRIYQPIRVAVEARVPVVTQQRIEVEPQPDAQ